MAGNFHGGPQIVSAFLLLAAGPAACAIAAANLRRDAGPVREPVVPVDWEETGELFGEPGCEYRRMLEEILAGGQTANVLPPGDSGA